MKSFTLKSLQNYAKRNEIHTVESMTVPVSSETAPTVELPPAMDDMCRNDREEAPGDPEDDWEDVEPPSEPILKRRRYQVCISLISYYLSCSHF